MLSVSSHHLSDTDLSMVRKYARFVLDRLVRPGLQNKSKVTIRVLDQSEMRNAADILDLKNYKAWCSYEGSDACGNKKFSIVLNIKRINKRAKSSHVRLKNILVDLGHELVHVKQYLANEMFDYANGDIRHKGVVFDSSYYEHEELYYESPWEIEAYGREQGLYQIFCNKLKEDGLK